MGTTYIYVCIYNTLSFWTAPNQFSMPLANDDVCFSCQKIQSVYFSHKNFEGVPESLNNIIISHIGEPANGMQKPLSLMYRHFQFQFRYICTAAEHNQYKMFVQAFPHRSRNELH